MNKEQSPFSLQGLNIAPTISSSALSMRLTGEAYGIGLDFGTSSVKLCIVGINRKKKDRDTKIERPILYMDLYPWSDATGKSIYIY